MSMRPVTWSRSKIQTRSATAAPGYLDAITAATITESPEAITFDVHHEAWRSHLGLLVRPSGNGANGCRQKRTRRAGPAPDDVIAARMTACAACEWQHDDRCHVTCRADRIKPGPRVDQIARGAAAQCPDGKW